MGLPSCLSLLVGAGRGWWESITGREHEARGIFSWKNVHLALSISLHPGLAGNSSSAALGEQQALCDGSGNPDGTDGLEITQGQGLERMREEQGEKGGNGK